MTSLYKLKIKRILLEGRALNVIGRLKGRFGPVLKIIISNLIDFNRGWPFSQGHSILCGLFHYIWRCTQMCLCGGCRVGLRFFEFPIGLCGCVCVCVDVNVAHRKWLSPRWQPKTTSLGKPPIVFFFLLSSQSKQLFLSQSITAFRIFLAHLLLQKGELSATDHSFSHDAVSPPQNANKGPCVLFVGITMGLSISRLLSRLWSNQEMRILMVGLDAAGKVPFLTCLTPSPF